MDKCHWILDIQRNSDCDPWCPHPCLLSHLHLEFLTDQNPVEIELPKLEFKFAKFEFKFAKFELSIYKANQANLNSSFGNSISTGFWSVRNSRWRWERRQGCGHHGSQSEFRCISRIPWHLSIQSKNSVNSCICQFLVIYWQDEFHLTEQNINIFLTHPDFKWSFFVETYFIIRAHILYVI